MRSTRSRNRSGRSKPDTGAPSDGRSVWEAALQAKRKAHEHSVSVATLVNEHAKKNAVANKSATGALSEAEARVQEHLRELAAWYMLQGIDEATARRRAQDEIRDNPKLNR